MGKKVRKGRSWEFKKAMEIILDFCYQIFSRHSVGSMTEIKRFWGRRSVSWRAEVEGEGAVSAWFYKLLCVAAAQRYGLGEVDVQCSGLYAGWGAVWFEKSTWSDLSAGDIKRVKEGDEDRGHLESRRMRSTVKKRVRLMWQFLADRRQRACTPTGPTAEIVVSGL